MAERWKKKNLTYRISKYTKQTDKIGRRSRNLQSFSDVGESDGI